MDAEFGNSRIVATLGLSTFVLGIALGPAWSPLSEFYGRRPIYLGSFAFFLIWLVPSAVAKNIETMIIARFFQGLAGSAFLSVSGGTVGDMFDRATMAAPMAMFTISPFVGPSIGPSVGGFINYYVNWRWTHYVLIIWSFTVLVLLCFFVPETYRKWNCLQVVVERVYVGVRVARPLTDFRLDPVLLRNKARKLRKETGEDRWYAPIEKMDRSILKTVAYALLRPFQLLIGEPLCLALDVYSAILLGVLYLFFGAFPLVFETNHGFNLWQVGLSFLGLLVGMVIGGLSFPVWNNMRQRLIEKNKGVSEPEFRLPSVMVGAVLVPIGLFWFGWTTYSSVHWIVPIIGSVIFGVG